MATKKTTTESAKPTRVILKNARITEKAANNAQYSIYLFDVAVDANKSEIAKAFKAQYKKTPIKVNTVTMLRKSFFRRGRLGFGTSGKKAYVFLPKGTTIDIA
ncbi:MAG TPA: 50S ribosomal protein L23 [Candidatus Paceibacterota bacterium]|jgi:ribosomal protein L23|nr:50S ribosomal protein L23 [Candidatus Paceibacterota bacterium]